LVLGLLVVVWAREYPALNFSFTAFFVSVFWTRIAFFLKMFALCLLISALIVDALALMTS
jgi:hypothetical protein